MAADIGYDANEIDDSQEINYPPIFRAIRNTGYTGYILRELLPKGDAEVALKQAFEMCAKS